jgi:NADH-quinone oxidoreductase subunit A
MDTGFVPILILGALAGLFAILSLLASAFVRPRRYVPAKLTPYESGIDPIRLPKAERFPVKFYVVAMLFIVFDIEAIFLYPWAVAFRSLGMFGLVEMIVFIGLVFAAYLYIRAKGGLEWEGPVVRGGRAAGHVDLPPTVERTPGDEPGHVLAPPERV